MNNFFATREIRTFDVETFISDVYNRFCGTPNEESREDLQQIWNKVLAMPRGGDASLYPNAHGHHPALLEVWLKAGDFWRANGYCMPARLLCDQYGIAIDEATAQKIAAAKAAINGTTTTTSESEETHAEATETPQEAQTDASGITAHPASNTPTEAPETATVETPCSVTVSDGFAVGLQAAASETANDYDATADDYDPGVIVPEAAYPTRTPRRRRRTSRYRPSATQPSLFDGCEITETTDTPAETASGIIATLKGIASNSTAREIAKGIGIIAAVAVIYECGLIIPFALLGGLAGGFIK